MELGWKRRAFADQHLRVFFSKTLFGKNCKLLLYLNNNMCFFIDAWKTLSFGSDYVKPIREELTLSADLKKTNKNYLYIA